MKIGLVGTELFHADGQTYTTKLIIAFYKGCEAPKNVRLLSVHLCYTEVHCDKIFPRDYQLYFDIILPAALWPWD